MNFFNEKKTDRFSIDSMDKINQNYRTKNENIQREQNLKEFKRDLENIFKKFKEKKI